MGSFDRVKCSTKYRKRRRGFSKKKTDAVNNVTINESTVNNELRGVNNEASSCVNIVNTTEKIQDGECQNSSISSQKVQEIHISSSKNITGYRFLDMEILCSIFKEVSCPKCYQQKLLLSENIGHKKGLSSMLVLNCSCGYVREFCSSNLCGKGYDINRRIVYAMRSLGQGHTGIEKFTTLMNMPRPMAVTTYNKIVDKMAAAASDIAKDTMAEAASALREMKLKNNNININEPVDIAVSVDGTWQRRGFSSNNGVIAALSVDTGKVIDVEAMSKTCKACCLKEHLKNSNPEAYATWRNSHICSFNYSGSAPGMEPEGAKRIFSRSIEHHNMRYTEFLGDGDSKSYSSVKDVYDTIKVKKLECVGHYQKRIGTRCRKLKKTVMGLGGRGRLTNATIDRLQNYFGVALRQNSNDLKSMKSATLASLFHVASSKENNFHYPHCPTGKDSWCQYNRDISNNTKTYKPGPGLPMDIVMKLRPMYEELTSDEMLQKCLHGKTQNQNESFNAMIWERIPKSTFISLKHLRFGVNDAVSNFNIGRKSSVLLYEKLNMIPGVYTLNGCSNLNKRRISVAEYKNSERTKLQRKIIRGKRYHVQDCHEQSEGKVYEAGGF